MLKLNDAAFSSMANATIHMNLEQVQSMWKLLKLRHNDLVKNAAGLFRVGDNVTFTDKNGSVHNGVVIKVNRVRIKVLEKTPFKTMTWRASPAVLKKV